MMQPANSMVPPPMAPPPQYQQQPPQQPSQQWMPQQPQYQVPPPQQPPAAGYYYQQPQGPAVPTQYAAAPASQPQAIAEDGIRSLWIGDLQYWMDEQYLCSCFAASGEVKTVTFFFFPLIFFFDSNLGCSCLNRKFQFFSVSFCVLKRQAVLLSLGR